MPELRPPPELLVAGKRVEHIELVAGPREPPLLELAGHRNQALGRRGDVLARRASPPRVRTRSPVAEDAPSEHKALLVLWPQLRERLEAFLLQQSFR